MDACCLTHCTIGFTYGNSCTDKYLWQVPSAILRNTTVRSGTSTAAAAAASMCCICLLLGKEFSKVLSTKLIDVVWLRQRTIRRGIHTQSGHHHSACSLSLLMRYWMTTRMVQVEMIDAWLLW
jgi:hypothetical protein